MSLRAFILPGLSLVWYSPISLIKCMCALIIFVVYFYSERTALSEIFYFMRGLFLQQKIAALQRSVARDFGEISQIRLQFFSDKTLESNIKVYHKKAPDYAPFSVMITWTSSYYNIVVFKKFLWRWICKQTAPHVTNEWGISGFILRVSDKYYVTLLLICG